MGLKERKNSLLLRGSSGKPPSDPAEKIPARSADATTFEYVLFLGIT